MASTRAVDSASVATRALAATSGAIAERRHLFVKCGLDEEPLEEAHHRDVLNVRNSANVFEEKTVSRVVGFEYTQPHAQECSSSHLAEELESSCVFAEHPLYGSFQESQYEEVSFVHRLESSRSYFCEESTHEETSVRHQEALEYDYDEE